VTALPSLRATQAPSLAERLDHARRQAISTGAPVTLWASDSSVSSAVPSVSSVETEWRFLPDGRAFGPGLDPRNGRLIDTSLAVTPTP